MIYWVADTGNDANDGSSYAQAKATLSAGVALLSQGDTLNVVGSITNAAGMAATIDGSTLRGTSYSDPACIIQATDASGNPAKATLVTTASYYTFFYTSNRPNYLIIRGFEFDCNTLPNIAHPDMIRCANAGRHPIRVEYCSIKRSSAPVVSRYPVLLEATGAYSGSQEVEPAIAECRYCYLEYGVIRGDNGYIVHADYCIFYGLPNAAYSQSDPVVDQDSNTSTRGPSIRVTNCTYDYRHVGASPPRQNTFFGDYNGVNTPNDERQFHSNLICFSASSSIVEVEQNLRFGVISIPTSIINQTYSGTIGYNYFVFNASFASCLTGTTAAIYDGYYSPDWPSDTDGSTTLHGTDAITRAGTVADIINGTAAWTWANINSSGYSIDLPKDYRIADTAAMTMAQDGGAVGAVQQVVNFPPVVTPLTFSATAGITESVTAGDGLNSGASDPNLDTLTFTVVSDVAHGTLTLNTTSGAFEYTADASYSGTDLFTFRAYDGITYSNVSTVTIDVAAYPVIPPGPDPETPIENIVDSAPFFRPVLELDATIKYQSTRNRRDKQDLRRYDENVLWEESVHRYFNLATNTTKQITLGGVASAGYLMVETDQDIQVSVNSDTNFVPVSGVLGILNTAVTSLHVKNESTINTARVVILAAD